MGGLCVEDAIDRRICNHRLAVCLRDHRDPLGNRAGTTEAFISPDLGSADTIVKTGYSLQMDATPFGGAPDTCNALGVGQTGQAFRAAADPLDVPNNVRYFATNAGEVIWEDRSSLWPTMPEAGDPPSGAPIKF